MNNNPSQFWNWFQENNKPFLFLTQVELKERDRMVEEIREQLHKVNDKLFFLLGGHPDADEMELIITAEGNREYFQDVKDFVAAAPELKNWKVIAFKPAMPATFGLEYEGYKFDPKDIYFQALTNPSDTRIIGLRLGFSEYNETDKKTFEFASFLLLDNLLGEKTFAENVGYVEATALPGDFQSQGYESLRDVKLVLDYILNQNKQC